LKRILFTLLATLGLCGAGTSAHAWSTYRVTSLQPGLPTDDGSVFSASAINDAGLALVHAIVLDSHVGGWILCNVSAGCTLVAPDTEKSLYDVNNASQMAGSIFRGTSLAWVANLTIGTDRGLCAGCGLSLNSNAYGLNDKGEATGSAEFAGLPGQQAFKYSARTGIVSLGTLGGTYSSGRRINRLGDVVGSASLADDLATHAFLNVAGTMQDLGTLGGNDSWGMAVNGKRKAVGCSVLSNGFTVAAFIAEGGAMTALPSLGGASNCAEDINEKNVAVGYSSRAADGISRAVVYQKGKVRDLNLQMEAASGAGWELFDAVGINDAGQIVGNGLLNGQYRAFLLTPLVP